MIMVCCSDERGVLWVLRTSVRISDCKSGELISSSYKERKSCPPHCEFKPRDVFCKQEQYSVDFQIDGAFQWQLICSSIEGSIINRDLLS